MRGIRYLARKIHDKIRRQLDVDQATTACLKTPLDACMRAQSWLETVRSPVSLRVTSDE